MAYIGIDFHKNNTYVTRMDEKGNILESKNIKNEKDVLEEFVETIGREDEVVLEATGNWYYFYELVEDRALNVTLSHPAKTKAIASARIKTDKIDSAMLAHLLRCDLIPASYLPERSLRDLRETLRYRASMVWFRTSVKNKVQAILSKNGIRCPHSDLFGKKSLAWLSSLPLRECYRESLNGYLALANTLTLEIRRVGEAVRKRAEESEEAKLLMTMPGISYYSSLLILSEIGEIDRFPSSGKLVSYAGLAPSIYSSGGVTRTGRITKTGSTYLRWILVENSHHAIRGSYRFEGLFRRISARSGKNAAKVAVARKMLVSIYHMLKNNQPFKDIERDSRRLNRAGAGKLAGVIA